MREALEAWRRGWRQNMNDEEIVDLRRLLEQHGRQIAQDADHAYFQRKAIWFPLPDCPGQPQRAHRRPVVQRPVPPECACIAT